MITQDASTEEIHCALVQSHASAKARSISIVADDAEIPEPARFAITFDFGSARLTDGSKALLDRVALVILKDEDLSKSAFFVDGHTDAVGSVEYNDKLGQDRADSSAIYLRARLDEPFEMKVRSFGETRLLDPDTPTASVNRRVEISPVIKQ
ncbi:MAG: OmpA family protein [Pseudomonadota bacterium]